ncbi:short-chain fatty acid transporter [Methyloversatilis sp. XJ19-49]|uniref:short-chain fatty acid transporter n=1 Tax=Methyloversatilis sp. XJ19-49 TaxID=2963429 RepID=UPI00211C7182|nr:short-chain fatty acid transporter [Methyloversatilis sp. XJ19-49]MCQ9380076.1 short-chain fatty acid transporter [Methyloversatilis sp. XJ19-49]MCQ9380108.1 short-chain fatty acid transporter [Methyloversatilis sp. XJ19-49]
MLQRVTSLSVRLVERWLPDPFVLVLLLTLLVFAAGIGVEGQSPVAMLEHWGKGFWNLLQFSMQMVLILVTGWVLATTLFFRRILEAIAKLAHTPGQAILLVSVVSLVASWLNWGFGLVIGAMFARQLARGVTGVDYRLLIASAYSGFVIWHGGLSGSVPLTLATADHFLAARTGVIATGDTIFSTFNLLIVLALFICVPILNRLMMPRAEDTVTVDPALLVDVEFVPDTTTDTPASRLDNSILLAQSVGIMGLVFSGYYFLVSAGTLNLNIVNFMFLFLGIMLHGRPSRFLAAIGDAARGSSGIIVQFPFYAGLMGMIVGSGLAVTISNVFVAVSTDATLPLFAFLSAGLVNIFVPSGGGQWAVQGPIMVEAAARMGADLPRVAMAVAWGDAWTNLIQPFWALPALAIAGLRAKDIMGYCLITLLMSGVVIGLGLTFVP